MKQAVIDTRNKNEINATPCQTTHLYDLPMAFKEGLKLKPTIRSIYWSTSKLVKFLLPLV